MPAYEKKKIGTAQLTFDGKSVDMDVWEGTLGERAVDIGALRKNTGLITYDPGYVNTGSCESNITFVDGDNGILRYRGYDIEDLANNCTFVEVAYLLIQGKLPTRDELQKFSRLLNQHSMIHEDMLIFFRNYPERAHPMAIASAMGVSLSSFYPELEDIEEAKNIAATRLLSKLRTMAAASYKKFIGEPFIYPSSKLTYCENLLNMMFGSPVAEYQIDPVLVKAMNQLLILHADHEQNASTSVVRLVGSTGANLYASIAAGICALWGPYHGGANQEVMDMLEEIVRNGGDVDAMIARAKDPNDSFRLMGFGHRVYKTYDPRAKVAKRVCEEVLGKLGVNDPLLEVAKKLEERALNDDYFIKRKLYPNVDFYTGITYRAMGFPTNMFTVLFAIGRLPGWIAQWYELHGDAAQKIGRPRQIYIGAPKETFVPIDQRVSG
ncbi:MAG TPA: citrate synthase [Kiritimatiellia bacterium]|nr:citrate synthase [Kiritimatiellia bacterium]HMO97669.1 citrate synthase [Kiritimatiellia bacterium]HMP95530.1 citrate synthase [Kiritimatiellia bacterium]